MQSGVSQVSIIGPLLFTIYINDLYVYNIIQPIMSAEDTNLFSSHDNLESRII